MRSHVLRPVLLVVASTFLASALAACSASPQPSSTLQVTAADDKGSVSLHVGDTLQITLEGNPTTGYQWEVASVDESVLKASGEPQYTPTSAALGSGGVYIFSFKALDAGKTTLELVYHRTFEKNVPPLQTFTLTVTVR